MDNNESPLKIVHSKEAPQQNGDGQKPMSFDELIKTIDSKTTVQEREQVVVDNLRRQGFQIE